MNDQMVKEEVVEPLNEYPFNGRPQHVIKRVPFPQVIKKENAAIHNTASFLPWHF